MRELDVRTERDHRRVTAEAVDEDAATAPLKIGAFLVAALAVGFIVANAAFLQPSKHPAPIFATRAGTGPFAAGAAAPPRPGAAPARAQPQVALVRRIQIMLTRQGYDAGEADGVVGSRTEQAIRAFERDNGLVETGRVSTSLARRLATPAPAPRSAPMSGDRTAPGETGREDILLVQRALSDLGYGPLEIDGVHGTRTAQAIQRFELDRGMPITGRIDDRTIAELVLIGGINPIAAR